MVSCFELLSIELLYELFDYMSSHEILYAFISLNYHLNTIINSYPLQIDFRTISRTNFDFVCQHLQPKQVISLIFSEKNIPDQVKLFHQKFPHFQHQFIHLKNVVFIKTETILLNFPFSVSRLTFQSYNNDMSLSIKQILIRHAKFLTYIKVNDANILQCIDTSFPELKHLIINGGGPLNLTQRFFYDSKIHHLSCYLNNSMILPNFRFTQVRELDLSGSIWTIIDSILSIVDLNQIRKLDITKMGDIPINKLNELLIHTSHLYHLVLTNFNPLLILPSHIRCLTFLKKIEFIDIDACCTALSFIESVELPVESEEIMIELINRIEYLHHIVIFSHIWSSLSDITIEWFQQNSSRLKTKNFTYQFGNRLFPEIHFSFTNK